MSSYAPQYNEDDEVARPRPVDRPDRLDFDFSVKRRRVQPISFRIGGMTSEGTKDEHVYVFTPPKGAVMLDPVINPVPGTNTEVELTKATFDWLGEGLSEADNDRIKARLRDRQDDLDASDLEDIIRSITKKLGGGRPTT